MSYTPPLEAEETGFKTTAPISGSATFNSTASWDGAVDGYSQVQTEVIADQDGTIAINFCADAAFTDVVRSLSIPYVAANGYQFFAAPAFANFIEYKFTNTSVTDQTDFYYTTKILTTAVQPQLLTTDAFIAPAMVTTLGRNIIVGRNDSGTFNNVATDNQNHLKVDNSNNRITYDEFPISELTAISQLTFPYNINLDLTVTESLGTGIISQSNDMAIIGTSAGTTATEFAAIESVKTITYRAGEGAMARFSAKFTDFAPNGATSVQGFGLGDANDGYGYMMIGASSEVNVAYRTNGVQTTFSQSQWNADTMDGSGNSGNPSGMDLDPTKGNIYQVSYGSGFGCAQYSIENQSTGHMVLVHTLHLSNIRTTPAAYNPTFALRVESFKDGSGPDTNDYVVSVADMSSFTQGKDKVTGTLHAYDNSKNIGGTETNVFTIQNKSTVFGGATGNNKVSSVIETISMYNDTNGAAVIRLWENATLGGTPSYTDIDANTSVSSVDIAGTTRTGGKLIWVGGVAQTGGSNTNVVDLKIAMRPGKTYTFTAQSEGGANPISVGVVWVEDF